MWFLLGTTLTASFFDSLNPSAIAQQMLLQATQCSNYCGEDKEQEAQKRNIP